MTRRRVTFVNELNEVWPTMITTIDEYAAGIWFDEDYGYFVDRIYAIRMKHDQPVNPVFYSVTRDVVIDFSPYQKLTKRQHLSRSLFKGDTLDPAMLSNLFQTGGEAPVFECSPDAIVELVELVTKQREQNKAVLRFVYKNETLTITLFTRHNNEWAFFSERKIPAPHNLWLTNFEPFYVHANVLRGMLKILPERSPILFHVKHDRIKITTTSTEEVEGVMTTLTPAKVKRIEQGTHKELCRG